MNYLVYQTFKFSLLWIIRAKEKNVHNFQNNAVFTLKCGGPYNFLPVLMTLYGLAVTFKKITNKNLKTYDITR